MQTDDSTRESSNGDHNGIIKEVMISDHDDTNSNGNGIDANIGRNGSKESEKQQEVEMINQYMIQEEIGKGAMGVVYKVIDSMTGNVYAIKSIKYNESDAMSQHRNRMSALRNEIAIMKLLDHPNIVRLHEIIDDNDIGSLYLVMDYVEGGPIMSDKDVSVGNVSPIPEILARKYFYDVISGLTYLHHHKVLHRDIKPSNMLLDKQTGRVKLCDFGVSSLTKDSKSSRFLGEDDIIYVGTAGTVAMMSPEGLGANGDRAYHGRPADIWAVGVSLYIFLFGKLPFSSPDKSEISDMIINTKLKIPSSPKVSKNVKDLLTKILEKNPDKRASIYIIQNHPWVQEEAMERKEGNWLTSQQMVTIRPTKEQLNLSVSVGTIIRRVGRAGSIIKSKLTGSDAFGMMTSSHASKTDESQRHESERISARSEPNAQPDDALIAALDGVATTNVNASSTNHPSEEKDLFTMIGEWFANCCGGDRKEKPRSASQEQLLVKVD